jgi:hypothetical protein
VFTLPAIEAEQHVLRAADGLPGSIRGHGSAPLASRRSGSAMTRSAR